MGGWWPRAECVPAPVPGGIDAVDGMATSAGDAEPGAVNDAPELLGATHRPFSGYGVQNVLPLVLTAGDALHLAPGSAVAQRELRRGSGSGEDQVHTAAGDQRERILRAVLRPTSDRRGGF